MPNKLTPSRPVRQSLKRLWTSASTLIHSWTTKKRRSRRGRRGSKTSMPAFCREPSRQLKLSLSMLSRWIQARNLYGCELSSSSRSMAQQRVFASCSKQVSNLPNTSSSTFSTPSSSGRNSKSQNKLCRHLRMGL